MVTVWHQAEGWGIVESPSLPGAASADAFRIRGEAVADHSVGPLLGLRPGPRSSSNTHVPKPG